jgi:hypothetical protein
MKQVGFMIIGLVIVILAVRIFSAVYDYTHREQPQIESK